MQTMKTGKNNTRNLLSGLGSHHDIYSKYFVRLIDLVLKFGIQYMLKVSLKEDYGRDATACGARQPFET